MKTTKIIIKNIFGIKEQELDGQSIEITGSNGAGKTSVIDAIRYALTNDSNRDYVIKKGESEGEILIETNTGLRINRKKRTGKADYKSVKENGKEINSPENFIRTLFSELQLNPVEFINLSTKEQNKMILDLIQFDWDLNWINEQFGEIPQGVDYSQNILQVLNDIQSEEGIYFKTRQDINREIRNKRAFINDISKDIPACYDYDKWNSFDLVGKSEKLVQIKDNNNRIQRAKMFLDSYNNKLRGLQADAEIKKTTAEQAFNKRKEMLIAEIERKKSEIKTAEEEIAGIADRIKDKYGIIEAELNVQEMQLDKDMGIAGEWATQEPISTKALEDELAEGKEMMKHLNEYRRMKQMTDDVNKLVKISEDYTEKIERARILPSEILQTAEIPVAGLSLSEKGIPLINGLPVSNLSEGEKLDLCVDIAISNPNALQMILLDGMEKLSDDNRQRLYNKCRDKGLQFIATRTTNDNELKVTALC